MKAVTIIGSLVLYGAACAYYSLRTGDMLAVGLAWNILLAALPLFLFQAVQHCRVSALRWAAKLVWVLLLPNAFYMITDLIHVPPNMEWVEQLENGGAAVRHSALLREWVLLLLIGVGAFFAAVLGCRALYQFERTVPRLPLPSVRAWGLYWAFSSVQQLGCSAPRTPDTGAVKERGHLFIAVRFGHGGRHSSHVYFLPSVSARCEIAAGCAAGRACAKGLCQSPPERRGCTCRQKRGAPHFAAVLFAFRGSVSADPECKSSLLLKR